MVFSTPARMATEHPEQTAQRLRRRGTRLAILFLIFTVGALAVGAWQLAQSQSNARTQLRKGYDTRSTVAAGVLQSLFQIAFQQGAASAAKTFGGPVTTAQMAAYAKQTQVLYTAIVGPDGAVIARSPGAPSQPVDAKLIATALKNGSAV